MLNLLRLKNWQIFWLATGLHLVAVGVFYGLTDVVDFHHPMVGQFATVANVFCLAIRLAWMYSMATHLHSRLRYEESLNLSMFKVVFVLSILIRIGLTMLPVLMRMVTGFFDTYMSIFTTISVISLIAIGYQYYFVAKSIVAVELARPPYLSEYVGTFFLFVLYPVGIWWIQPRLNRIFDGEPEYKPDTPLDHNLN